MLEILDGNSPRARVYVRFGLHGLIIAGNFPLADNVASTQQH